MTAVPLSVRKAIGKLAPNAFYLKASGFCPCCNDRADFLAVNPWLRDNFVCLVCKSIPRQRALLLVLERNYPDWRNLAIHESSPSGGGASDRIKRECKQYLSTQYHPDRKFGSVVGDSRNENLESQTFDDESFDLVITQDVLEHVYDPAAAFAEIARTLKPGGSHIFSVPLVNKHSPSQPWALRNDDGSPNFLHEPEYHGNPVDARGAPVTFRWGYDIVKAISDACGLDTTIVTLDDLTFGIRAEYIEILVTKKNAKLQVPGSPDPEIVP